MYPLRTVLFLPILQEFAAGSYVDGVTRGIIHSGYIKQANFGLINRLVAPEQIYLVLGES